MKSSMSVMVNRKPPQSILSPGSVAEIFTNRIEKDALLKADFPDVLARMDSIRSKLPPAQSCKWCAYNAHSELVVEFVRSYKSLPEEKKAIVSKYVGQRQWIPHEKSKSWINIVNNIVEPYLYETREVDPPPNVAHRNNLPLRPTSVPSMKIAQESGSMENPVPRTGTETEKEERNQVVAGPQLSASVSAATVDRPPVRKVIFKNFQAPGDIVMMTAAIRDLHLNHPGKFITDVRTNSIHIWESNPYITKLNELSGDVEVYNAEYPLIQQSNQGPFHFSEGFTEHFEDLLGVRIKNRIGRGHIVIGPNEEIWGKTERTALFSPYGLGPDIHYWVLNAGYKNDFTAKMWPKERYQKVVDHFKGRIAFVQIGHASHNHPDLSGVINLVGKTDDRMLIRLVWASSGVLTPCSYPMTLAAAVPVRTGACNGRRDRPCVVVAGGREPSHWQAHVSHQFIHTCGSLPCCDGGGCWKSRVKPIGDGDEKDKKNMCSYVVDSAEGVELPFCMDMITADEVIRRIEMYYTFYEPSRPKTHSYNRS